MGNYTFTIIKPEIVEKNLEAEVLDFVIKSGFRIVALRKTRFSKEQAEQFYGIHREKPFFRGLIQYITSGPVYVALVEKNNAVEEFRKLIGATNPAEASEGTVRKKYGTDIEQNAIHGSDSDDNAALEASYFFSLFDRF